MVPPLACSVRACERPLARSPRAWACAAGHAFDIARSGYVSLLQPHDRRSAHAGDSLAAVEARRRLLDAGIGTALIEHLSTEVATLALPAESTVVELGCGSGEFLGRLSAGSSLSSVGLDLSRPAVDHAARAFPGVTWVVANADRKLPLLTSSVDLVVSVHARRAAAECARVLHPLGWLIVAVPAPDDLSELRTAVLGAARTRERAELVVHEHHDFFTPVRQFEHRERRLVAASLLDDLLTGTYRGARHAAHAQRVSLADMVVTLASNILVFQPHPSTAASIGVTPDPS